MFSIEERDGVVALVVERARGDERIVALARTGSLARGTADRWSDVDLFLGVDPPHAVTAVVEDLGAWAYADLGAVHHFDLHVDLPAGAATYRALLLGDALEIDLGVAGAGAFATVGGEPFEVVFDDREERHEHAASSRPSEGATTAAQRPSRTDHLVGLGWHHALHARTAIARARPLKAEHWISALREHTTTLAALRCDLPAEDARGADRLPLPVRQALAASLVTSLDAHELARARQASVQTYLIEVEHLDTHLAARLRPAITGESD